MFNFFAYCDEPLSKEMITFSKKVKQNISQNITYPLYAKHKKIEGIVDLEFTIDKYGTIENIKSKSNQDILEKSALEALNKTSPVFIPFHIENQFPAKFKVTLRYILENDKNSTLDNK